MSKEKIRDLVICVIALIALVLAITTNVFASGSDLEQALGANNNVNNTFNEIPNATTNNIVNNTVNNTNVSGANNTNNTNVNANTNKTGIPYTGVDYSVVAIIAVCGISAVYAYKKIRDYKSL